MGTGLKALTQGEREIATRCLRQLGDRTCVDWVSDASMSKLVSGRLVDLASVPQGKDGKRVLSLKVVDGFGRERYVTWRLPQAVIAAIVALRDDVLLSREGVTGFWSSVDRNGVTVASGSGSESLASDEDVREHCERGSSFRSLETRWSVRDRVRVVRGSLVGTGVES